jgi:hypothetical protein
VWKPGPRPESHQLQLEACFVPNCIGPQPSFPPIDTSPLSDYKCVPGVAAIEPNGQYVPFGQSRMGRGS